LKYLRNIEDLSAFISTNKGLNINNNPVVRTNPDNPTISVKARNPLCFISSLLKKGKRRIVEPVIPSVPTIAISDE
jgi:hypothetical protein